MFVGATFCSVAAGEPHPGRAAVMIVTVMTKASRTTSFLTSLPSMAPDYWLYVCSGSTSFRLPKPVQDECQYPGKCARLSVYALLRGVLRVSPTPEPRYRCSDHGGRDHIPSFLLDFSRIGSIDPNLSCSPPSVLGRIHLASSCQAAEGGCTQRVGTALWRGESGRPCDCHRDSIYRPVNCSVVLSEPAGFNLPASSW